MRGFDLKTQLAKPTSLTVRTCKSSFIFEDMVETQVAHMPKNTGQFSCSIWHCCTAHVTRTAKLLNWPAKPHMFTSTIKIN